MEKAVEVVGKNDDEKAEAKADDNDSSINDEESFQLYIKPVYGNSIALMVKNSDSIRMVKEQLLERTREIMQSMEDGYEIFKAEQVLWKTGRLGLAFGGKQLQDVCTVSYYNIRKNSTIFVTYGLAGEGTI